MCDARRPQSTGSKHWLRAERLKNGFLSCSFWCHFFPVRCRSIFDDVCFIFYYKCSTRKDWIITQDLVRCSADTEDVSSRSCDLLYVPLGRRRAAERSMSGMVSCFIANQIGTWPSGDFMYVYLISCVRLPFWMSPSIMSVTSRSAFTTEWWPKGKTKNATDAKGKKSHQTVALHNSHNSYCHQRFNHSLLFFVSPFLLHSVVAAFFRQALPFN